MHSSAVAFCSSSALDATPLAASSRIDSLRAASSRWTSSRLPLPRRAATALHLPPAASSSSSTSSSTPTSASTLGRRREQLVTVEEVQEIARSRGLELTVKTLGPAYRVVCRDEASGKVVGVTSGFTLRPMGLMHCDTLQIFTKGLAGEEGERIRRGALGLGLLLGGATFAHGASCGCTRAEILAIDDDEAWHQRLVRYYRHFGFVPVARVTGDKLADLPHMLVWGGAGTRMDADIAAMLRRWTAAIRAARSAEVRQARQTQLEQQQRAAGQECDES